MRIASDLEVAVADGLDAIAGLGARAARQRWTTATHAPARALLARIADSAREALADVRRVLGILRRDGDEPQPRAAGGRRRPRARRPRRSPCPSEPPARAPRARRRRATPPALDRLLVPVLLAVAAGRAPPPRVRHHRPPDRGADRVPGRRCRCCGAAATRSPPRSPCSPPSRSRARSCGLDTFPAADGAALVCAAYAIGAYAGRRTALAGLGALALGEAAHAAAFHPQAVVPAVFGGAARPVDGRPHRPQPARADGDGARARRARRAHPRAGGARRGDRRAHARRARAARRGRAQHQRDRDPGRAAPTGIVERDPARAARVRRR